MDVPTIEPQLEAHLKVAADGHEHQVGICELATVKDYQLLPHHPGGASRSIPPGSPGSPHQLVPGQLVEAVRLKLLLHHLPSLLLSLQRLFVVFKECRTDSPPQNILNDVFGRFGNLIEVYCLKGKRCGYAKYANKESARQAMEALNHQTLCGTFLKVMIAEQSYSEKVKRAKLDTNTDF